MTCLSGKRSDISKSFENNHAASFELTFAFQHSVQSGILNDTLALAWCDALRKLCLLFGPNTWDYVAI